MYREGAVRHQKGRCRVAPPDPQHAGFLERVIGDFGDKAGSVVQLDGSLFEGRGDDQPNQAFPLAGCRCAHSGGPPAWAGPNWGGLKLNPGALGALSHAANSSVPR